MDVLNSRSLAYAFNCTVAALAAVWISGCWGLPNPGWAALTVFISSQPLAGATGAVAARAAFRLAGTLTGCAAALVLIPALASTPELLIGALALWATLCVYLSVVDKSARSYAFLLASYTPVLVGLPLAGAPVNLFDTLLLRVEEVGTGALCAAIAHTVFFPRSVRALATGKLRGIAADARKVVLQAFETDAQRQDTQAARVRLAQGVAELHQLVDNLRFDAAHSQSDPRLLHAVEDALVALALLVAAVEDRLDALLAQPGGLPPQALAYVQGVAQAIATDGSEAARVRLEALKAMALPRPGALAPAQEALVTGLVLRTEELAATWQELAGLVAGQLPRAGSGDLQARERRPLHVDHGLALFAGAAVGLTLALAGSVTYLLGWQQGSAVVGLATTGGAVFAAVDDPRPLQRSFILMSLYAVPVTALYVFAILPAVNSFPGLALALGPLFFAIALFMASSRYGFPAYGFALTSLTFLSLQAGGVPEFSSYSNLVIACITGTVLALVGTSVYRVIGPATSARRIVRASQGELLRLLRGAAASREAWASRMVDRIALLLPRVGGAAQPLRAAFALARLGAVVIELRAYSRSPRAAARPEVDAALQALAARLEAPAVAVDATCRLLQDAAARATAAIAGRESGELRSRALAAAGGLERSATALA